MKIITTRACIRMQNFISVLCPLNPRLERSCFFVLCKRHRALTTQRCYVLRFLHTVGGINYTPVSHSPSILELSSGLRRGAHKYVFVLKAWKTGYVNFTLRSRSQTC